MCVSVSFRIRERMSEQLKEERQRLHPIVRTRFATICFCECVNSLLYYR